MAKLAGDHVQVLVDGYELTGDHNQMSIPDMREMYDITSFGDAVHKFIPGRRSVSLEHAGYVNAATARSHPVLNGSAVNGIVSILLGDNTDPVVGDPIYSLPVRQGQYKVAPEIGNYVPFSAIFANRGELGGWGIALAVPVAFTTASNGAAVDNDVQSTDGGSAFLHVLTAAASDTYTITVEGSATGAFGGEETTLTTFTLDASALGSEFMTITGTIPRYTRWKAVRNGVVGNTVKIAVSLVRF